MKNQIRNILLISTLAFGIPGTSTFAQQQVYGYQLMTEQERIEHRTKMQSMKTAEEREQYRMEHHRKMQERAKQQGITLPDYPPMPGMGGGRGMGENPGGGRGRK
ncbi:MAG: hypothetical protein OEY78_02090 [Gammaproteobacteria bacterium]|nr:hypothetical protein [Gammaproteobacteria bacterium]